MVDINLVSLMSCAMRFRDMLAATKGSLIVVSSAAAYYAPIGNPAYGASKTGAEGLTRVLAAAWAAEGIRFNGIAPAFVPTRLTKVRTAARKSVVWGNMGSDRVDFVGVRG